MKSLRVGEFLQRFRGWADTQAEIHAVALVGSYARDAATDSSDVDVVVVAERPEIYLRDHAWAHRFGTVEREQVEDYGIVTSLRVWYAGGLEVEYGLTDKTWVAMPLDDGTREVISAGMKILFERGQVLSQPHVQAAREKPQS